MPCSLASRRAISSLYFQNSLLYSPVNAHAICQLHMPGSLYSIIGNNRPHESDTFYRHSKI